MPNDSPTDQELREAIASVAEFRWTADVMTLLSAARELLALREQAKGD